MRPVGFSKSRPGKGTRQRVSICENAASDNCITWRMQLEQEHLARLEGAETSSRRRPEIDLGEIWLLSQHLEPVSVGHSDNEVNPGHFMPIARRSFLKR